MAANYGTASITDRMMRAARLDSRVYEEVEHDLSATSQALTVVMISAIAAGIGQGLGPVLAGRPTAAFPASALRRICSTRSPAVADRRLPASSRSSVKYPVT